MHHVAKLVKLDLSVVVFVNLVEQFAQDLVVLVADAERALYFVVRDRAATVLVEQAEGSLQLLLID